MEELTAREDLEEGGTVYICNLELGGAYFRGDEGDETGEGDRGGELGSEKREEGKKVGGEGMEMQMRGCGWT